MNFYVLFLSRTEIKLRKILSNYFAFKNLVKTLYYYSLEYVLFVKWNFFP